MTTQTQLFLYMPVIHQGYVQLLEQIPSDCDIYLLQPSVVADLLDIKADPATLQVTSCMAFLKSIGRDAVQIVPAATLAELGSYLQSMAVPAVVHLVDDGLGREIATHLLAVTTGHKSTHEVVWHSVFLRWDSQSVHQIVAVDVLKTTEIVHQKWMKKAEKISKKSSDWWRQVGAIAVKNSSEIIQAYNQGMPDDHTPYQYGAVRDHLPTGSQPELANYIHGEQSVIAQAAAQGLALDGADLYVTHFPCPVCAKLIALAGFRRVYFKTGSATLDGKSVLEQYKVELIQVLLDADD